MKKVLIITYYWPPSGGPGVQRCLYFVKYLREFGWEPIVYTVENGEYPYHDESLAKEIPEGVKVIKHKAWEPFTLYKKWVGLKKEDKLKPNVMVEKSNRPFFHTISTWIRGNIFIPDARMFWIKPSIKYLTEFINNNKIDAILTSSPPHSVQLIGYGLKNKFGIPWLVDLRDPWSKIFFADVLKMSFLAKQYNESLEKKVLQRADAVVTVSNQCAIGFEKISGCKPEVITNGYDKIESLNQMDIKDQMIIAYGGTLSGDRNPELLWYILHQFLSHNSILRAKVKLQFYGAIDPAVFLSIKENQLGDLLETYSALSHDEYLKKISNADILLLIGTKNDPGVITGKFFEYLAMKKPILSISPKGSDVEIILKQCNAGINVDYNNESDLKQAIQKVFNIASKKETFSPAESEIEKYSRRNLTKRLAGELNRIVNSKF